MVKKAIHFMEIHYVRIMSVEEIINYLGTSYNTLSKLFKQAEIMNPKAVLMSYF